METTLTILKAFAFVSVVFSVLFVSARVYAGYIRKEASSRVTRMKAQCSEDCSYQPVPVPVEVAKPKRKQVKKRVSAIKNDKLVITPVEEKPKRGRKKKS